MFQLLDKAINDMLDGKESVNWTPRVSDHPDNAHYMVYVGCEVGNVTFYTETYTAACRITRYIAMNFSFIARFVEI